MRNPDISRRLKLPHNVDFIQQVDLYTGAFPAARGNALSSVMDFRMKDGNDRALSRSVTLGTSDAGLTLDGPMGARGSYIFSLRRSYLQLLFEALQLPFLPTYTDAQFKARMRVGEHDEVELLGLGAIDQLKLNTGTEPTELNRYILDFLPETPQWNYTVGGVWKRFDLHGFRTLVVSRNQLDNAAVKYANNDASDPTGLERGIAVGGELRRAVLVVAEERESMGEHLDSVWCGQRSRRDQVRSRAPGAGLAVSGWVRARSAVISLITSSGRRALVRAYRGVRLWR